MLLIHDGHVRSDDTWNHTFKYITDVAALYGIEVEEERVRSKRPRRSAVQIDYVADSTLGHRDPLNNSQSLKVNIYFPVIDHILSEMVSHLGIMKAVQACSPTSPHFLEVKRNDIIIWPE